MYLQGLQELNVKELNKIYRARLRREYIFECSNKTAGRSKVSILLKKSKRIFEIAKISVLDSA